MAPPDYCPSVVGRKGLPLGWQVGSCEGGGVMGSRLVVGLRAVSFHGRSRFRTCLAASGAALLILLFLPRAAGAEPMCFGKPATILGTEGDDNLTGTAGADVIIGLGGNDTINGAGGGDLI